MNHITVTNGVDSGPTNFLPCQLTDLTVHVKFVMWFAQLLDHCRKEDTGFNYSIKHCGLSIINT